MKILCDIKQFIKLVFTGIIEGIIAVKNLKK